MHVNNVCLRTMLYRRGDVRHAVAVTLDVRCNLLCVPFLVQDNA